MEVDRASLEGLEGDLPLSVIFEPQSPKIILTDIDRQILAPIIVAQFELDEPPLLEGLHLVGAGAERRLERRRFEVAALPPGAENTGMPDDDQMSIAAALLDEAHR